MHYFAEYILCTYVYVCVSEFGRRRIEIGLMLQYIS